MTAYSENDVMSLTKPELTALINRQRERWPYPTFNPSHVRVGDMRAALLDPQNGFTQSISAHTPHDPSQSPDTCADRDLVTVHLFLQDRRDAIIKKSATDISISTKFLKEQDDRIFISAVEVMARLQSSFSAIQGPAKLSYPYYLDPTYDQCFVIWENGSLQECQFDPDMLSLSIDKKLLIYVDTLDSNSRPGSPLGTTNSAGQVEDNPTDPTVLWLTEQVETMPGFSHFQEMRHHRVQNSDILEAWSFASEVYHTYYRRKCDVTNKRITRLAIQATLGIGETWLTEALDGNRMAQLYGQGGLQESSAVVCELQTIRPTPFGRSALLRFLESWENSHPI